VVTVGRQTHSVSRAVSEIPSFSQNYHFYTRLGHSVLQNCVSGYSEVTEVLMQIAVAKILLGTFIF
jgi:hypothetical protein